MLTTRLVFALVIAGLMAIPVRTLHGQQPSALPAQFFSDSTLWQRILTHVVSSLTTYMLRTGVDSNAQPWQLEIPGNTPQRDLVLRQLRTILRARPPASADTLIFTLVVSDPHVNNDTARVIVRTDFGKRCRGSSAVGGFGNVDSVVVPRHPRAGWGAARSLKVVHGVRVGCAGPW